MSAGKAWCTGPHPDSVVLCWMVAIMYLTPYYPAGKVLTGLLIFVSPLNLYFAVGLLCALNLDRLAQGSAMQFLGVAVPATALLSNFPAGESSASIVVTACALAGILLASTKLERWPVVAMRVGDGSYGLFLMHFSAIAVAAEMLRPFGLSVWVLFAITTCVGLAVGVPFGLAEFAFHRACLRAFMRAARKLDPAVERA